MQGQMNISGSIRQLIAAIPKDQLADTKPSDLVPALEAEGYNINHSARNRIGQLLVEARNKGNSKNSKKSDNVSILIREVLSEISVSDLPNTYPRHIMARLEEKGCEITPYTRNRCSSVLSKLKKGKQQPKKDPWAIVRQRTELVVQLVENCGSCDSAIAEIERVKKILGSL